MARIDKALPNVPQDFLEEEEVVITENTKNQELTGDGTELITNEDGSVDVDFAPGSPKMSGGEDHFSNLADILPDDILGRLASQLYQQYEDYKNSRKDWEDAYVTGLDLLGFKYTR